MGFVVRFKNLLNILLDSIGRLSFELGFQKVNQVKKILPLLSLAFLINGSLSGCKINSSLKSASQNSDSTNSNSFIYFTTTGPLDLEEGHSYDIGIDLSVAPSQTKTLTWSLTQTQIPQTDYPSQTGTLTIQAGQKHLNLHLRPYNDLKWEADKTLRLKIESFDNKSVEGVYKDFNLKDSFQRLENVKQVVGNYTDGCALLENGTVKCWGCGTGWDIPRTISGLDHVVQIAQNEGTYLCALLDSDVVICGNYDPDYSIDSFFTIPGLDHVADMGGGFCAALEDGTAKCWKIDWGDSLTPPAAISGISTAIKVDGDVGNGGCALLSDGTIKCWGYNSYGQLGDGTTTDSSTPVTVLGVYTAIDITVASNHRCAVLISGEVKCWGYNAQGQLGNGTTTNSSTPVNAIGVYNATQVSVYSNGSGLSCALLNDGKVKCWGYNMNFSNELYTYANDSYSPVEISGLDGKTNKVFVTGYNVYAVMDNKGLQAFGNAYSVGGPSQGIANLWAISSPVDMLHWKDRNDLLSMSIGERNGCALLTDQTVECWGNNYYGQLGNGSTFEQSLVPVKAYGLSQVTQLSTNNSSGNLSYNCAVLNNGTAKCWGKNSNGQLGNGTTNNSSIPLAVSGLSNVVHIEQGQDASSNFACALLSDGTVKCWGKNSYGRLGDGTTNDSNSPVTVTGLSNVTQIILSHSFACALLSDGTAKCWGYNGDGELGDGTTNNSSSPVAVTGLSNATDLKFVERSVCALISDGTVKCWGNNYYGQLGDGTNSNSSSPVTVVGLSNVTRIERKSYYFCALISDGTVKCWGSNSSGQLGDGTRNNSNTIISVSGVSHATQISLGFSHGCALINDGTIKCWGDSYSGKLGTGSYNSWNDPPSVATLVPGLTQISKVRVNEDTTCAQSMAGDYLCWGSNSGAMDTFSGVGGALTQGTRYNPIHYVMKGE